MSGFNANLLLAGIGNSPWLSTDELQAPAKLAMAQQRNALLNRMDEQTLASQDMEMIARASAYLETLPDTAARQAAYPGVVSQLQQSGFAKNAPSVYPGDERISQLARMGTPSKELLEQAGLQRDYQEYLRSRGATGGGTTAAPGAAPGDGAAPALAIPGRGTGGPGASAAVPTEWLPYFYEASRETGIPVEMLIAQARQESSFDPNAKGKAGEIGVFQIMPSTAQSPGFGLTGVDPGTLTGPENVRNNILFGARYLKARGGQGDPNNPAWQANALRSYNAGGDPNYVANVNRYRPGLAPSDPAAAVTTYTPGGGTQTVAATPAGGGVAARTGGTNVAGPGAGSGGAVATDGTTTATPAQQPPAATTAAPAQTVASVPAPPPRQANGLTTEQNQTIAELQAIRPRTQADFAAQRQKIALTEAQFRKDNDTEERQYRADVQSAANAARAAQREERVAAQGEQTLEFKRREDLRQQEEQEFKRQQEVRRQKFEGAPSGYQWAEDGQGGRTLTRSPGFQGETDPERLIYRLENGDPNSAQYASDYAARKWQVAPGSGNVIENDMSMFRPPSRPVERPTYLPQPSPQALEDVRKVSLDAETTVQAIDNYLKVLGQTDGATIGAFLNNPRDPKAQKLLGAFDAMKMSMRGPSAMNTGVLQPAEMTMLREDLISPQTARGFTGSPEAAGARLGQIKLTLLRKWDAERRSVGKDGVLVRTAKEYHALPSGKQYYDEDGTLRTKE